MLMSGSGKAARIHYLPGTFRLLSDGDHVVCAVTGERIPLHELRYWSVERQEPYVDARGEPEGRAARRKPSRSASPGSRAGHSRAGRMRRAIRGERRPCRPFPGAKPSGASSCWYQVEPSARVDDIRRRSGSCDTRDRARDLLHLVVRRRRTGRRSSGMEKPNRLFLAAVARALSITTSSFLASAWLDRRRPRGRSRRAAAPSR